MHTHNNNKKYEFSVRAQGTGTLVVVPLQVLTIMDWTDCLSPVAALPSSVQEKNANSRRLDHKEGAELRVNGVGGRGVRQGWARHVPGR